MGGGARSVLLLASFTIVAVGIHFAAPVLLPILVGLFMAAAAQPVVEFLERHRCHPALAVFLAVLAMIGLFAAAFGTVAVGAVDLATNLPSYERSLHQLQLSIQRGLTEAHLVILSQWVARQDTDQLLANGVSSFIAGTPALLSGALVAALIAFFALMERNTLAAKLGIDVDGSEAFVTGHVIIRDVQRYLGVKTIVCALTGLLAGLVCIAAGVPNALFWAAVAFLLNYIPVVGSIIAAAPPVLLTMVVHDIPTAVLVTAAYGLINLVVGNVLEPRWLGRAAGLSPLVVLIAVVFWGGLLGPVGALLSVPVTMVVKIALHHTRDLSWVARVLDRSGPRQPRRISQPPPSADVDSAAAVRPSLFSQP